MNLGDLDITKLCVGSEQALSACLGTQVVWPQGGPTPPTPSGYSDMCLTICVLSAGTVYIKQYNCTNLEANINNGGWHLYDDNEEGSRIYSAGDTIALRSESYQQYDGIIDRYQTSAEFLVQGNAMSLYRDPYSPDDWKTCTSGGNFTQLFYECTGLTDATNLVLPGLCDSYDNPLNYKEMFFYCTSLTGAPELPALDVPAEAYAGMFYNCTSLTTAPELPATNVGSSAYSGMFYYCTSLTTPPPELPMIGLTGLTPCCYQGMFHGCESLETAPALCATTLAPYCYAQMFYDCRSLSAITCLATGVDYDSTCVEEMTYDVASEGIFIKASGETGWSYNSYSLNTWGIPLEWFVADYPDTQEYIHLVGSGTNGYNVDEAYAFDDKHGVSISYNYQPLSYFQIIARGVPVTISGANYYDVVECTYDSPNCRGQQIYYESVYDDEYNADFFGGDSITDIQIEVRFNSYAFEEGETSSPITANISYCYKTAYRDDCDCSECDECGEPSCEDQGLCDDGEGGCVECE